MSSQILSTLVDDYLKSREFPFSFPYYVGRCYTTASPKDKILIGIFIMEGNQWIPFLIFYIQNFPSQFVRDLEYVFKGYYFGFYGTNEELNFVSHTLKVIDQDLHRSRGTYAERYRILEKIVTEIRRHYEEFLINPREIVNCALIKCGYSPLLPEEVCQRAKDILMSPNSLYARAIKLHFRFGHRETLTTEEEEEFARAMRELGFDPGRTEDLKRQLETYLY